jgi:hypothetical protein
LDTGPESGTEKGISSSGWNIVDVPYKAYKEMVNTMNWVFPKEYQWRIVLLFLILIEVFGMAKGWWPAVIAGIGLVAACYLLSMLSASVQERLVPPVVYVWSAVTGMSLAIKFTPTYAPHSVLLFLLCAGQLIAGLCFMFAVHTKISQDTDVPAYWILIVATVVILSAEVGRFPELTVFLLASGVLLCLFGITYYYKRISIY